MSARHIRTATIHALAAMLLTVATSVAQTAQPSSVPAYLDPSQHRGRRTISAHLKSSQARIHATWNQSAHDTITSEPWLVMAVRLNETEMERSSECRGWYAQKVLGRGPHCQRRDITPAIRLRYRQLQRFH